jgi:hypothetical protein
VRRYLPCEIRRNGRGVGRRRSRISGDGLTGRSGDHRDHRRVGRLLRGGLQSALRWSYQGHDHRRRPSRVLVSSLLALRSVAVEFGPAEVMNSVAVRPVAYYADPLIFDNTIAGWIFGKLVSDLCSRSSVTSGSRACWHALNRRLRR